MEPAGQRLARGPATPEAPIWKAAPAQTPACLTCSPLKMILAAANSEYTADGALVPKMSVAVTIIEHMNEYITPVVLPGADEPPEQAPVPAERLEAELCLMAGHLAAATSRFLDLVGEYDASNGWAA